MGSVANAPLPRASIPVRDGPTDRLIDGQTDRQTDRQTVPAWRRYRWHVETEPTFANINSIYKQAQEGISRVSHPILTQIVKKC